MGRTHLMHETRIARQRSRAGIRDKITQKPELDESPIGLQVVIGRTAMVQTTYGPKHYGSEHPLAKFVNQVESIPDNNGRGEIVEPLDIMLRLVSDKKFDEMYQRYADSKRFSNATLKSRRQNARGIKEEISEEFRRQSSGLVLPIKADKKPTKTRANMFEPAVEIVTFDAEPKPRGNVTLKLLKRPHYIADLNAEGVAAAFKDKDHPHNKEIIVDDLGRINEAFNAAGLVDKKQGLHPLVVDDLALDVAFFTYGDHIGYDERTVYMPLVPSGLIEFQPLSIHEAR